MAASSGMRLGAFDSSSCAFSFFSSIAYVAVIDGGYDTALLRRNANGAKCLPHGSLQGDMGAFTHLHLLDHDALVEVFEASKALLASGHISIVL